MVTLLYDLCLLITMKEEAFGVVSMQTDNILFLASKEFAALEDSKLQKAYLIAKLRDELSTASNLIFNRYVITIESDSTIYLTQKDQGRKLQLVNKKGENPQQDYLKQHAYSVYIALIY